MAETVDEYIGLPTDILSEGVRYGEVRKDIDPEGAAMLLFGMMLCPVNIWALLDHSFAPEQEYVPLWNTLRQAVIKR